MVETASQTGKLQIKNGTQSQGGNSFSDRQSTNKQWHSRASFLGQKKWYQNKKQTSVPKKWQAPFYKKQTNENPAQSLSHSRKGRWVNFVTLFQCFWMNWEQKLQPFREVNYSTFVFNWESLTSDPKITELVTGVKLELNCDDAHLPQSFPSQPSLQAHEITITDREIEKLHEKNVISQCFSVPGQCVSPVFTRLKKRQVSNMIWNLKCLNNDITFYHFKMETLQTALKLITLVASRNPWT